jgi:pyruvate dehydrogenase E2 component (dihydrolipoamide acetyltransferase)
LAYELSLPDIGEGLTEAEVVRWLAAPGDEVEANQPLVEIETDKAIVEIPSPRSGVMLHQGAPPGTVIHVGDLLAVIGAAGESWSAPPVAATASPVAATGATATHSAVAGKAKAVPLVRKLARDLGVDLNTVTGTGNNGQITRDDVAAAAAGAGEQPAVDGETLSKLRRTIAEHMSRSWEDIPHVTVWGPAEATRLLTLKQDDGVSIETLLVQVVLPALAEFPVFSANFDGERLTIRSSYDIGIAVDTEAGLMVPVLHDAASLDAAGLDEEIARLVAGAQGRTLTTDELRGQSFTISNVGAVGGGYGTPIIPHGTTAVLSVGRARDEVIARDGRPVIAPLLPLALSFDHRIIDGSTGTRFLNHVIATIENT